PKAPVEPGLAHRPGGKTLYAYLVRGHTTTDLTPDQIHQIGLDEVARIRARMDVEMKAAGWTGDFAGFLNFLRTDPQFYASTREELLEKASEMAKRADGGLPPLFATLPRLPYDVQPVPPQIEENYTTGRYNGGSMQNGVAAHYIVNTSKLDQRPLYELPALTLHEAVPGHHVQIALQPVVDLALGRAVGHEALSRFADGDPERVFAQAHRAGNGNALEAAAIRYALQQRPETGYLSVNVSVGALVSEHVRAVLPDDLRGIVLEITEQADTEHWDEVAAVIAECRARGAHIAIDDWGRGYSTMERTMRLRPEVVKLDRSLVLDLEDPLRQRAVRTLVDWAHSMGATVCAEGIEHPEQAATLRELGVTLGQGYLFGVPTVDPAATAPLDVLGTAAPA
ncbi:MAG: DUF885 family protein, partial [Micrococcales bacterium]|nr:DUF885 family protein [Micrococcales bacterium]